MGDASLLFLSYHISTNALQKISIDPSHLLLLETSFDRHPLRSAQAGADGWADSALTPLVLGAASGAGPVAAAAGAAVSAAGCAILSYMLLIWAPGVPLLGQYEATNSL